MPPAHSMLHDHLLIRVITLGKHLLACIIEWCTCKLNLKWFIQHLTLTLTTVGIILLNVVGEYRMYTDGQ